MTGPVAGMIVHTASVSADRQEQRMPSLPALAVLPSPDWPKSGITGNSSAITLSNIILGKSVSQVNHKVMKTRIFPLTIFAFLLILFSFACQDTSPQNDQTETETTGEVPAATTQADNDLLNWKSFVSEDYQLAVQYPEDWMVLPNNNLPNGKAVINIFPTGETPDTSTYSETHGDKGFSYLAIYPNGLDRDFPWGRSMSLAETTIPLPNWNFPVNETASRVLQLEDGEVWGFYLQPAGFPANWSDKGFIFVQYSVQNFQAGCIDASSGETKEMTDCNLTAGDRMTRSGTINTEEAYTMNNILEALKLGGVSS
jgi:hypothetical protein